MAAMSDRVGADQADLRLYAGLLKRDLRVILFIAGTAALLAALLGFLLSQRFTAVAEVLVATLENEDPDLAAQLVSEARIVRSEEVLEQAAAELGGAVSATDLERRLEVEAIPESTVLHLSYPSSDREQASAVVTQVARAYIEVRAAHTEALLETEVSKLEQRAASLTAQLAGVQEDLRTRRGEERSRLALERDLLIVRAGAVQDALATAEASLARSPRGRILSVTTPPADDLVGQVLQNLVLGSLIGALLGTLFVLARSAMGLEFRSEDDMSRAIGAPLLAEIPEHQDEPVFIHAPTETAADSYRSLRLNAHTHWERSGTKTMIVAGTGETHRRDAIAANLALATAEVHHTVCVVCADFEESHLERFLPSARKGSHLATWLEGEGDGLDRLGGEPTRDEVVLFPSGDPSSSVVGLLSSERFDKMLAHLESVFDLVIVVVPPVSSNVEGALVASRVGAVLLVTDGPSTSADDIRAVVSRLQGGGGRILGWVLDRANRRAASAP